MEGTRRHAKVVELGAFIIMRVGAHEQWWGTGRRFSIMVVVGTCGGASALVVMHVGACGWWWRRHVKGVEQGVLIIMHVGALQWWWGAGHCLSIMVVVGTCGWHWVVVTIGKWCWWVLIVICCWWWCVHMASWSPFMGVHGGSLRAMVGCSWVGAWALLVTCDHLGAGVLLLWAAGVVVVVRAIAGGVGGLGW